MNTIQNKLKTTSSERKTVFLFLGLRIYMSDLLRTDYIKALSEKYRVIVFLRELEGEAPQEYYKNEHITYRTFKEPGGKFWTLFDGIFRNELIRIFDDNPSVIWRNSFARDKRRLALRAIMRFFPRGLIKPRLLFWIERQFVPGYAMFQEYVREYRPALVLTATPGLQPSDAWPILCARKAGIPTVSVDTSWDNLSSHLRHVRNVDYFILWNNMMKDFAVNIHGYSPEHVFVSGAVRFDRYFITSPLEVDRETFLKSKGLDPNRRTVFFAARSYGDFFEKFIESFVEWQKTNAFGEPLNLFVRVHPVDAIQPYEKFKGIDGVHVERSGKQRQSDSIGSHKVEMDERDYVNTKMTLKYCDVCVSIASTMSVEAMVFDKPVINIGFAGEWSTILTFPHYQPLIEWGGVQVARDMDDLKNHLERYLKDPSLDEEGRKKVLREVMYPTDGKSYLHSVDFLAEILAREGK